MELSKKQAIEVLESFGYKESKTTPRLYRLEGTYLFAEIIDGNIKVDQYFDIPLSILDQFMLARLLHNINIIEL